MENTAEKLHDYPIGGVPPDQVMAVWHRVEPVLKRAVTPETGVTLDHILTALQRALMQLWVVGDFRGVAVTSIEQRPTQKVLFTQYLAGENFSEWIEDWVELSENYARYHDCVAVEFAGRKGWTRYLRTSHPEYKQVRTIMRRELTQ